MHPHAVAGTMESIRTPSPPADAFSRTPKAIRALIEKMWAFNPTDRASAASVSSFLEACTVKPSLTGLGVKAP